MPTYTDYQWEEAKRLVESHLRGLYPHSPVEAHQWRSTDKVIAFVDEDRFEFKMSDLENGKVVMG